MRTLKWFKIWAAGFFLYPTLILAFCLIGCFFYSFCVWDWAPWTNPTEILNMLNPLAHTWSRVVLLIWTIITGIASYALNQLG